MNCGQVIARSPGESVCEKSLSRPKTENDEPIGHDIIGVGEHTEQCHQPSDVIHGHDHPY
jgi:hypothetical protein